jgi:hypothetical protein
MRENNHSKSVALVMYCTSKQPFPYWVESNGYSNGIPTIRMHPNIYTTSFVISLKDRLK